jgi:hypothetical protein
MPVIFDYQVHSIPYHDLYISGPPPRTLVVLFNFHDPTRLETHFIPRTLNVSEMDA